MIQRIREEMESTGAFDKIRVDKLGSLLGYVGKPGKHKKLIAIDAHVDTVGVGDRSEWKHDPYQGKVADGKVWGRGAGDQEGAIPAMVYAAKIMRDLELDSIRILPADDLHRDGRRLRWALLAIPCQGREHPTGCGCRDRFHELQHPAWSSRTDGDRCNV